MNDKSFLDGGLVGENADFIAELEDSSGINVTGLGLGHDLMAILDDNQIIVLNEYFQNEEGSYKRGGLRFPFRNLASGIHSIRLKAWDNFNNSSEKTIFFEVGIVNVNGLMAKEIKLYPNPFSNNIYLSLENAYAGQDIDIQLIVYDIVGNLLTEKTWKYENSIARPGAFEELAWDGNKSDGSKLPAGTYFCKIGIKSNTDGAQHNINKKIILIR